jgi:hypothetical protein
LLGFRAAAVVPDPIGTLHVVQSNGRDSDEVQPGTSFHTLVLPLAADAVACRALEARFVAGFQVYRAVLREGAAPVGLDAPVEDVADCPVIAGMHTAADAGA